MVLTKAIKQSLQESSESVPQQVTAKGSQAMRLKLANGKSITLHDKQGKVTDAGKYWYETVKGGAAPQIGFNTNAEPYRRHRTEYIKLRNGNEAALRTWMPNLNEYKYTKLGK